MVSKEKPSLWLDLYTCANDNDPIPSNFSEGSGNPGRSAYSGDRQDTRSPSSARISPRGCER